MTMTQNLEYPTQTGDLQTYNILIIHFWEFNIFLTTFLLWCISNNLLNNFTGRLAFGRRSCWGRAACVWLPILGVLVEMNLLLVKEGLPAMYSFSHNHGSGNRLYLKCSYYWRYTHFYLQWLWEEGYITALSWRITSEVNSPKFVKM